MKLLDKKLEIFRMAATLKNFSEAAVALGMTQPNVTQQIALLEKEFDTLLFERTGRQLLLTPAGETLLKESERLFSETGEIRRRVRNASRQIQHYKVGGTMTAGGYLLPRLTAEYMLENPMQHLDLRIANTQEISELLKKHVLEAALVEGPFDQSIFFSKKLMTDTLLPAAAPGMLYPQFSIRAYLANGGRLILREIGSGTRYYLDLFLTKHGIPDPDPDQVYEVNSFDALKHLVRIRFGITVISPLAIEDEINAGTLVTSAFQEGSITRELNFIYLPSASLVFAERFIAFCRQHSGTK